MTTTAQDQSREVLVEGKAKIVRPGTNPEELSVSFKDAATAFNGQKFAEIPGKGRLNAIISSRLFSLLESFGIPTCFVKPGDAENELVYRRLKMVPLEVVIRNAAFGSLCKRFGFEQGRRLQTPLLEFFLKDDQANDPQITEALILELGILPEGACLEEIKRRTYQINEIFIAYFESLGILCADFKLEFGVGTDGRLYLGDELSPDNFRLRDLKTGQVLDKDVFRQDLGDLVETYETLLSRMNGAKTLKIQERKTYRAEVFVKSRKNILNPESKAILNSLHTLGFGNVTELRAGRRFEIRIEAPTMVEAEAQVLKIAEDVLSNPVIEDFTFSLTLPEVN